MNLRYLLGNFSAAFISQGISMALSMVTSLVVPKVIGVTEYGYWQLFTFYISYEVLALLGVADGIYLKHGGTSRSKLPVSEISGQFLISLCLQLVITFAIVLAALGEYSDDAKRAFVLLCSAVMLPLQCVAYFVNSILQAVNEPRLYSYALALNRIILLFMIVPLMVAHVRDFEPYVASFVVAQIVMCIYAVHNGRTFLLVKPCRLTEALRLFWGNVQTGAVLAFSSAASTISLGIIRLCLDITQPIETFGVVSLSLSLVTFILSFISQVGMVLFPALRQESSRSQIVFYRLLKSFVSLVLPCAYFLYWPIAWIVNVWLPDYSSSVALFAYLIPICAFEGKMQTVYVTFFKVLREERKLLAINVIGVILSGIVSIAALFGFRNIHLALVGLSFVYMVRSVLAGIVLNHISSCTYLRIEIEELCFAAVFLLAMYLFPQWIAFRILLGLYVLILFDNRALAKGLYKSVVNRL